MGATTFGAEADSPSKGPRRTLLRTHGAVTAFFLIWSVVLMAGVWKSPRTLIPADVGDPVLNVGILYWNARALPLTDTWWSFPSFAPLEGAGGLTENLLATSVIATPVLLLTGDPILAYNAAMLAAFALSGVAMYALVFWLTRSVTAGVVAGIAFAFSPFRAVHLSHLQTLWTFGIPLALLGLHMYFGGGRGKALVLFAAGWLLTIFGSMYYAVFLGVYVACWLAWFGSRRQDLTRVAVVCGVGVITSLPILPFILRSRAIQTSLGLSRTLDEIRGFSADVAGFLQSSPLAPVANMWTSTGGSEGSLFPGFLVLGLCAAGVWLALRQHRASAGRPLLVTKVAFALGLGFLAAAGYAALWEPLRTSVLGISISLSTPSKPLSMALLGMLVAASTTPAIRAAVAARSTLLFYAASALLMFLLCLGPEPTLNGSPILYGTPYRWLLAIPGIDGLRVPARFWMLGIAALAIVAGLVVPLLSARIPGRSARALGPVLALGLLCEGWLMIPAAAAPAWNGPGPSESGAVVMELPAGTTSLDVAAQTRAIAGGYRAVNGYSGYFPPHYPSLLHGMRTKNADVLAILRAERPVYVSLRRDDAENIAWLRTLAAGASVLTGADDRDFYRLDPLPALPVRPAVNRVPLTGVDATCNLDRLGSVTDGDLDTRWQCGPQQNPHTLTFDAGRVREFVGVAHTLGPFYYDFPRLLTVEVSEDREQWLQVYTGDTTAGTLRAALADPRLVDLQLRFPPTSARYIRLTQSGVDPVFYWSVAEIAALVPRP